MKVLLLDIEGTTSSISFVYETLFPYARAAFEQTFSGKGLLVERWGEREVQDAVAQMAGGAGRSSPIAAAGAALALMHGDVKDTGLKTLQGLAWERGYASGELSGHVFPDVAPALERATSAHVRVAIYSSGSVHAQKLIFGRSQAGDLGRFITAYFDTTTGPKKAAESYRKIAAELGVLTNEVVFCTDNLDEARAARDAGMQVAVALRPGNPALPSDHGFEDFTSFDELALG